MTPIRALLDRIRWDDAFGNARFEVDYYDRVEDTLVRAPLQRATLGDRQHFFLELVAPDASIHSVPLHRVRVGVARRGTNLAARLAPHGRPIMAASVVRGGDKP